MRNSANISEFFISLQGKRKYSNVVYGRSTLAEYIKMAIQMVQGLEMKRVFIAARKNQLIGILEC